MKKIFIIIVYGLLITTYCFAQRDWYYYNGNNLATVAYDTDAQVYFSAMTTLLSDDQKIRVNSFIMRLKDSLSITSLSEKFDVMYLMANETSEASLKNLVKRSHDATAVNSPSWTQWEGFAGNGSTSYLNTNYTAIINTVTYTQNSASVGVYARTNQAGGYIDIGGSDASNVKALRFDISNGGVMYYRINSSIYADLTRAMASGFYILDKTSKSFATVYYNGSSLTSNDFITSDGLASVNILIGAYRRATITEAFSPRQYSFIFLGAGLSAVESRKITNCIEWYMDNIGTGVIP